MHSDALFWPGCWVHLINDADKERIFFKTIHTSPSGYVDQDHTGGQVQALLNIIFVYKRTEELREDGKEY